MLLAGITPVYISPTWGYCWNIATVKQLTLSGPTLQKMYIYKFKSTPYMHYSICHLHTLNTFY